MKKFVASALVAIMFSILFVPLSDADAGNVWKLCSSSNYKEPKEGKTCCKATDNNDKWVDTPSTECKLPTATFDSPIPSGWQGPDQGSFLVSFTFQAVNNLTSCEWRISSYNGASWTETFPWYNFICSGTLPVSTSDSLEMGSTLECRDSGTGRCKMELRVSDGLNTVTTPQTFDIDITKPVYAGTPYTITGNPHKGAQSTGPVYTKGSITHAWSGFSDAHSDLKWFEVWSTTYVAVCETNPDDPACNWSMQRQDTSPASGSWSQPFTSGDFLYGWHSVDNVGNVKTESTRIRVVYDGTSPNAPKYNIVEGLSFNSAPSLDIDFSDDKELEKIECKFDAGGTFGFIDSAFEGKLYAPSWSVTKCGSWGSLSEGSHYIYFKVTDEADNTPYTTPDDDAAYWIIKDTKPPESRSVTIEDKTSGSTSYTNDVNVYIDIFCYDSNSGMKEYRYDCNNDGTFESGSVGCSGCTANNVACSLASGDGSKTVTIECGDNANNAGPAMNTITLDTTPPDTNIDSGPTGLDQSASVTFEFSSTENPSTFECSLDGGVFSSCTSPKSYTNTDGDHEFRVRGIDQATNPDPTPALRAWTTCSRSNPTITIKEPAAQEGEPGDEKTYSIETKNNDVRCGTELFDLTSACAPGWTCTFPTPSLSIASGATEPATISITSSSSATTGKYLIPITATNNADPTPPGPFKDTQTVEYNIICIYRLSMKMPPEGKFDLATKQGTAEAVEYTWTIGFTDDYGGKASSSSCETVSEKLEYALKSITISGSCGPQTGIYSSGSKPPGGLKPKLPLKFLDPRKAAGDLNNAFKVYVKRPDINSCTLSFSAPVDLAPTKSYTTFEFDPSFTVKSVDAPAQSPAVSLFDFSGDKDVLNVKWEAFYTDEPFRTMEVKCGLNCDPRVSNCDKAAEVGAGKGCLPYPVKHDASEAIKKGSCSVSSPAYDYTMTNKVECLFYDPSNSSLNTFVNHDFAPIDFDVKPENGYKITTTVGHKFDLKIDVTNKGLLSDSYVMALSGPATVEISPATITTPTITSGQLVSTFSSITPLIDKTETITLTVTSSTSGKVITRTIEISPGLFALPEFGLLGLLQIIIIAAVVYFLFVNRLKHKPKRKR